MKTDIVVVGSGVAGLIFSLSIKDREVILITKKKLEDSDSYLAQGGICVKRDQNDREDFIEDTMKAGHYKNKRESVEVMVDESRSAIESLISYGVKFEEKDGELLYTKEGGHSKNRILYCGDHTGASIMEALIEEVKKRSNIKVIEECKMTDLIVSDNRCFGILVNKDSEEFEIRASYTILATGGVGGLYKHSTNYPHISGDGLAMALKYKIKLKDMNYVQIHPTAFYEKEAGRRFLISESVRGEGAELLNKEEERFVDELKPRDIVSKAMLKEMEKDNRDYEWINMKPIPLKIKERFPKIYGYLKEKGIDPNKNYVPVVPAQHYMMGGIEVDLNGLTSMDRLLAAGEVACTGVHGANRLASNSLLESVVFAKRAAKYINENYEEASDLETVEPVEDKKDYKLLLNKMIKNGG